MKPRPFLPLCAAAAAAAALLSTTSTHTMATAASSVTFDIPMVEVEASAAAHAEMMTTTPTAMLQEDGVMCDSTEGGRLSVLAKALGALRSDFHVENGSLSFHNGGNPAGKYGICQFDERLMPPALKKASKATAGFPLPIEYSFLLGARDAVIWMGCTPPPSRYFSIRSYLAYRFPGEGRNISGYMPGAELGDPINNAVIKTTGGPHDPFSKTTLFVSTGDQGTYRRIKEAFRDAGFPEGAMNLDVLPTELVKFRNKELPWVVDRSDTIAWQFRVNEWVNPAEGQPYLDKVWPIFMLQAKDDASFVAQPLYAPPLKERGTGESEEWLRPSLNELIATVEEKMASERGLRLTHTFPLAPSIPDAIRCTTDLNYCPVAKPIPAWNRTDCQPCCDWFSRDSLYSILPDDSDWLNLLIPSDRVLMLVGINHALLGKASFTNFLVTGVKHPEQQGHTPNFTSSHLAGSGQYFLPLKAEAQFLYAQELSRDCGSGEGEKGRPFCEVVSEEAIAPDEYLFFAERAYLERETTVGPSPEEIISPVILAFDPVVVQGEEKEGMREEEREWRRQQLQQKLRGGFGVEKERVRVREQ